MQKERLTFLNELTLFDDLEKIKVNLNYIQLIYFIVIKKDGKKKLQIQQ